MEYTNEQLLDEKLRSDSEADMVAFKQSWERAEEIEAMIEDHDCTEDSEEGCDCHEWRIELEELNKSFSISVL